MTLGEKIKMHRKQLNLTQTELGERLGVQKNAVSKWECGRVADIPTSKIKAMAQLFDVRPSYLMGEEPGSTTQGPTAGVSPDRQALLDLVDRLTDEEVSRLLQIARLVRGE